MQYGAWHACKVRTVHRSSVQFTVVARLVEDGHPRAPFGPKSTTIAGRVSADGAVAASQSSCSVHVIFASDVRSCFGVSSEFTECW